MTHCIVNNHNKTITRYSSVGEAFYAMMALAVEEFAQSFLVTEDRINAVKEW